MANDEIQHRLEAFAASGLTQAALSRASGIDRSSISLYLSGRYKPKADKLLRLAAAALSVTPEWLSGMEANAPEPSAHFTCGAGTGRTGRSALHRGARPRPPLISPRRRQRFLFYSPCHRAGHVPPPAERRLPAGMTVKRGPFSVERRAGACPRPAMLTDL